MSAGSRKTYEQDRRDYWNAVDSAEYKAAVKRIMEISELMLPELCRRLGISYRGKRNAS